MKNGKFLDAIGMLDEDFLEENLKEAELPGKRLTLGRTFRNLLVAVLTVALLVCVAFAVAVSEDPAPQWEPYAGADEMLDILFGTGRYIPNEGMVEIRRKLVGTIADGTAHYEEERIPVISSASREPVSEELAALVEPYIIPVGKSVVDPTGTITLEIMAYLYEPKTHCGIVYLKLTDPTGEFCGYVPERPAVVVAPGEEIEDLSDGIYIYLQEFTRRWGKSRASGWPPCLRLVEEMSDETTWTFVMDFYCDNYDIVDMDVGFETEPMVDYRPYRIDIDLERSPTMETIALGNAGNKELVTISPIGIRIDGDAISDHWQRATEVVIHFDDGSSYVVVDEEACIYGYSSRANDMYVFANILDISEIESVEINGVKYVEVAW